MTSPVPPSLIARVAGTLYLFGACLVSLSLALPHPAQANEAALYALIGVAASAGAALCGSARRMPMWAVHVSIALGSTLICGAVLLSGVATGVYATMFVWVVVLTAYFFPGGTAMLHLTWLAGVYALTLAAVENTGGYSGFTRWLLVVLSLSMASWVTSWVVLRGRRLERRVNRFFTVSADMLFTADAEGRFVEVNEAWRRTLGYSREELVSRPVLDFVHPDDRARTEAAAAALFDGRGRAPEFENRYRAADGSWRWMRWSCTYDTSERLVYGRAADVTALKRLEEDRARLLAEVSDQARTDPLTGLPNRRWLMEELDREIARSTRQGVPLCAAMLDVDRFKDYNDRHGHLEGDGLLREASDAWRATLRVSDFLARYGGEEFVVLLPAATADEAAEVVERMRQLTPRGRTCSAGVAQWAPSTSIEDLLAAADAALYDAKARGRDCLVIAPGAVVA